MQSLQFDTKSIVASAGTDIVHIYDRAESRHWYCGPGADARSKSDIPTAEINHICMKEGFLIEGRNDGKVGAWSI